MWSRACVGVTVLMAAAVHPAVGQSGTEFTIGGGVAASAGGQQFTDPVPFNEVAGGVTGAVRWPLSKSARLGLSVEWARFPFTGEDPSAGMTGEGVSPTIDLFEFKKRLEQKLNRALGQLLDT